VCKEKVREGLNPSLTFSLRHHQNYYVALAATIETRVLKASITLRPMSRPPARTSRYLYAIARTICAP